MSDQIETTYEKNENENKNENEIENDVLSEVYDMMPSLATYVLFARKMSNVRNTKDENQNTIDNMLAVLAYLIKVPLEDLEEIHNSYSLALEDIVVEDYEEEYKNDENAYLDKKAEDIKEQLKAINEMDQQVTEAIIKLEDNIEVAKKAIAAGKQTVSSSVNTSNMISSEWGGGVNNDFNSLFSDQAVIPPGFEQTPVIPNVFEPSPVIPPVFEPSPNENEAVGALPPLIRQITISPPLE